MRVALFVLVVAAGCASAPSCPTYVPSAIARPFLWRVTGPHGSIVIQATHQAAGSNDVPAASWVALDQAQLYVSEAEEATGHDAADPDEPQPLFELPRGHSLQRMLSDDDFMALREYIGISNHELSRLKPWVAFMLLGRSRYSFPDPSMNASLLDRAKSRGLALAFLETWDDQVHYLDAAITPAKLSRAIRDAPKLSCELSHRLGAFRAGDDAVFANEVVAEEPVVARIDRWHAKLRELLDSGQRAFVALGVGQLVGPYGLLARLAADGYTLQRLQ